MQMARHYWLATGKPGKYKVISLERWVPRRHDRARSHLRPAPHVAGVRAAAGAGLRQGHAALSRIRDRGTGTDAELVAAARAELREAILREGPDTVSAVIMEPVISSGGFIMPPIGWLRAVRALCDELDVLMIADEVITGFGRTGRWFAVEHDGVVPDIMSVAKGITSGYIPLSAAHRPSQAGRRVPRGRPEGERPPQHLRGASGGVRRRRWPICRSWRRTTWSRTPRRWARGCSRGLRQAVGKNRLVGEVRGRGLMVCVELVEPDGSGRPLHADKVAKLDRKAWERGRDRLRARSGAAAGAAALHHARGGRPAGRHRRGKHRIAERRGVTKRRSAGAVPAPPNRSAGLPVAVGSGRWSSCRARASARPRWPARE